MVGTIDQACGCSARCLLAATAQYTSHVFKTGSITAKTPVQERVGLLQLLVLHQQRVGPLRTGTKPVSDQCRRRQARRSPKCAEQEGPSRQWWSTGAGVPTFCMASFRLFVVFLATPFFFCPSTSNFFLLWSSSKGLGAASATAFAEPNRSGIFRFFLAAFFAILAHRHH